MYGLRDELLAKTDIQIAAASFGEIPLASDPSGAYKYYNVKARAGLLNKSRRLLSYTAAEQDHLLAYLKIVREFKPDIIHVFGTENPFGLIAQHTKVPVVIHIQSILNAYVNAYFPPGHSVFTNTRWNVRGVIKRYQKVRQFKLAAEREARIFSICQNYMGRNDWDRSCLQILSPNHKYYHVDEILRNGFYCQGYNRFSSTTTAISIISILSDHPYKGIDLVFKTARTLKKFTQVDFKWEIYGDIKASEHEIRTASNDGIVFRGIIDEKKLIDKFKSADLYVHPSYIEGSNNSVCEAQILGLTVLACNVGGIPGLIKDNVTGILVPSNDPLALAYNIRLLYKNRTLLRTIGGNARKVALDRHDKSTVVKQLTNAYEDLIKRKVK